MNKQKRLMLRIKGVVNVLMWYQLMEFSIKFDTVKSGWSIVYIEGVTGYNFQKNIVLNLSLKIDFVLANRE